MPRPAIEMTGLSKSYPPRRRWGRRRGAALQALQAIDLTIPTGEFFGLLGPNGAGKTTLIKTLVGLARWETGTIRIFGHDARREPVATKRLIGLAPQEQNVDRYFTVRRIMLFQGGYFGLARAECRRRTDQLLAQFELTEKAETEFWRLSGGMQKRVLVARALLTAPRLLILDEPSAGIDVEQRQELWRVLKNLNRDGTTIILTTHYIDEAEALCERVGIIDLGTILELGAPRALIARHCERYFTVRGERRAALNGYTVEDVAVHPGSLEEVFLKLTGKSIHVDEVRE